ncbi:MAG TPA: hypothetical protein VGX76_17355 [Pirellulales bacterium]|nr:hypothetical protein [Pirellulales bacterium]
MTTLRADNRTPGERPAKWPRSLTQVVVYALMAFLALSHAGCASKPVKQPATIQEFLKQPRPQ